MLPQTSLLIIVATSFFFSPHEVCMLIGTVMLLPLSAFLLSTSSNTVWESLYVMNIVYQCLTVFRLGCKPCIYCYASTLYWSEIRKVWLDIWITERHLFKDRDKSQLKAPVHNKLLGLKCSQALNSLHRRHQSGTSIRGFFLNTCNGGHPAERDPAKLYKAQIQYVLPVLCHRVAKEANANCTLK